MGNALRALIFSLCCLPSISLAAFSCPSGQQVVSWVWKTNDGNLAQFVKPTCVFNQPVPPGAAPDICFKETLTVAGSPYTRYYTFSSTQFLSEDATTGNRRYEVFYDVKLCLTSNGSCGAPSVQKQGSYATIGPVCGVQETPQCADRLNKVQAIHVDASSLGAPVDYCLNGCKLRVSADAHNVHLPGSSADRRTAFAVYDGQTCGVGTPQPETAPEKKNSDGTDGACTADKTKCISLQKKNCGYVNGESRCVTANQLTPEDPCTQTGSGAVFCRADAATPPKPDNGTPGQPATPDAKFDVQDPTLIGSPGGSIIGLHYYKPSTVNSGSNNPGSDGNNNGKCEEGEAGSKDCTPLEGGGDCEEGEECGEDSASGDGCTEEPQCRGEPVECYLVIKQWETMCALAVPENAKIDEAIEAAAGDELSESGSLIPEHDPDGGEAGVNVLEELQRVLNGNGSSNTSCIADMPLNLHIGGVQASSVIPFSLMCPLFKVIGVFVLLSAGMKSAWIMLRGYGA